MKNTSFDPVISAFILGAAGQFSLFVIKNVLLGAFFFLAGIIFLVASDFKNKGGYARREISGKTELFYFSVVMLTGIFFRLHMITTTPAGCFVDEAANGMHAVNIMDGAEKGGSRLPVYIGGYTSNASMFLYFIAAVFKAAGVGVVQIRMASVVFGILSVPAVYFLLRCLFGPKEALTGAFLLAVMRWHVNFSRIGFHAVFAVFILILVLYFFHKSYKEGKWIYFGVFGAALGLSQYTYTAARLLLPGLALVFIYLLAADIDFYKKNAVKLLFSFLVFLAVSWPMIDYIQAHTGIFMERAERVSVFNRETRELWWGQNSDVTRIITDNIKKTFLMFNHAGDNNPRHNIPGYPVLGFLTGIFAVLGFGYSCFKIRSFFYFMPVALFLVFLAPGFFTIEAPQSLRTIMAVPFIIFFCAVYIGKLTGSFETNYGRQYRKMFYALLILLLISAGFSNYTEYFIKQKKDPRCWAAFSTGACSAADYLRRQGKGWRAVIDRAYASNPAFNFLMAGKDIQREEFYLCASVPLKKIKKINYIYMLAPGHRAVIPELKRIYPEGGGGYLANPYDSKQIVSCYYKVPYKEAEKYLSKKQKTGVTVYYYRGVGCRGGPVKTAAAPFIYLNGYDAPVLPPFSAEWKGKINIKKGGEYKFLAQPADSCVLFIKGGGSQNVSNRQDKTGPLAVYLDKGRYDIVFKCYSAGAGTKVRFLWSRPGKKDYEVVPGGILSQK